MTYQTNIRSLAEIKNLIEDNNIALRGAIRAIEILSDQALQQPEQAVKPIPQPIPQRNYPGYTTPPKFGFMSRTYE